MSDINEMFFLARIERHNADPNCTILKEVLIISYAINDNYAITI